MSWHVRRTSQEFAISLVGIALLAVVPLWVKSIYWLGVLVVTMYFAMLSAGWNLQIGYTGQISLAPATFGMVGAYTTGLLWVHLGIPPWAGIAAGCGTSAVIGALLATLVLRLRGPYLALTTFAVAEAMRFVAAFTPSITGGDLGINVPGVTDSRTAWYFGFLAALLVTQIGLYLLLRSPAGLYLQTIRDDDLAAQARGVHVVWWKCAAFTIAAGISGLAGALYAHFARVVNPDMGALHQTGLIIAMVIISGKGSLVGPLIGAAVVYIASEALRDVGGYHAIIFALLVILFARFCRDGLWGFVRQNVPRRSAAVTLPPAESVTS